MKTTLSKLAAGLLMASAAIAVNAQQNSTSSIGDVSARVEFDDITVTQETALDFGAFLPSGQAGSLTIRVANGPRRDPLNVIPTSGFTNAEWLITGVPLATFTMTFPESVEISTPDGTNRMTVDSFRSNFNNTGVEQGTIASDGQRTVLLGARLVVNANQPRGVYSGQYPITVAYN